MFAAVGPKPALHQRVKVMIATALLALSMIAGVAGTTTQVDAAKRQPKVRCDHYSQSAWILIGEDDPGPGGYWDCYFV